MAGKTFDLGSCSLLGQGMGVCNSCIKVHLQCSTLILTSSTQRRGSAPVGANRIGGKKYDT
jgi:hypothetical protein